ncbi:MSMEG_1061 family FMN-dependent PPOX-type flavoprotein [Bradyrhizobium sp. sGM-13]|uniref:MSMEG_1061 family FMN-dependent PPOX-type flavoprotein n=1 Tax=Bradyrhizobium sp. sGM-13 TaxID=2831781 RepID=UPI001BCB15D4|nr:MSMEG_1061 family FMN-dependent PPOX-type flavoprotein [Bradyrhizobium sp. sGM-13]
MVEISELRARFREVVSTEDELRAVVGEPPRHSIAKVVTAIDHVARTFIEHAPFAFVASAGEAGLLDISPKGDPAGFVKVLDDHTLAVPDRLGNRRIDTFRNVLHNPNVGIIFLIPGVTHTLRVSGKAIIVRDDFLRDTMKVSGRAPNHVLVVGVEKVFSHCPKCMIRSGLWQPDTWAEPTAVPSFAETLVAHAKIQESVEQMQAIIERGNKERLY